MQIHAEALELRNALKLEARLLARHGLLNRAVVEALRSENGYRNVELMALIELFRQAQGRLVGRTFTPPDDLVRFAALATKLFKLAAVRESRRQLSASAKQERLRAFTLMHKAYSQARRAVQFLCWDESDRGTTAPSFYGPHGGRRRGVRRHDNSAPIPEPGATAAPSAAPFVATAPTVAHVSVTDGRYALGLPAADGYAAVAQSEEALGVGRRGDRSIARGDESTRPEH